MTIRDMTKFWIVLETMGPKTLPLAERLSGAGFEVWAPSKVISKRRPRSNVRRDIRVAMTPGYVFARGSQLFDLIAEASRPVTNHPAFRVARWGGIIPRIPDAKFDALRHAERRNLPAKAARMFRPNDRVRTPEGPFAGLPGIVKAGRNRWAWVLFPGFSQAVQVDTALLVEDVELQASAIAA